MTSLDHAIQKTSGPCVILAGAGTGKTTAIVEKVNYLVKNNVYTPEKIVCITFSNEAANNLLLRVQKALGASPESEDRVSTEARLPIIRTFHAFSADVLRLHGHNIGLSEDFKILDTEQAMILLHRNLKVPTNNCQKYISTIGSAKDLGMPLSDFQTFVASSLQHYQGTDIEKRLESMNFELQTLHIKNEFWKKKELIAEIKKLRRILDVKKFTAAWNAYEKMKQKGNYQDYADLNANALRLLQQFPECATEFQYVVVDEFQDTNKLQLDFLIRLARHGNITVVGDMNQSIYRFRGAYSKNLELFKEAFSVTEQDVATLAKSHRSPNTVLRVAHQLIRHNYASPEACFFVESAQQREGRAVEVIELQNAHEEARKIVEIVQEEQKNGTPLEEICVMFRAHQYGRIIRRALEQAGIPYHAVAKSSLLKQKSVKTALDYLTILNALNRKEKGGEQAWWDLAYQLQFQNEDLIAIGSCIKEYTRKQHGREQQREVQEAEPLSIHLLSHLEKLELSEQGRIAAHSLIEKLKQMLAATGLPVSQLVQEVYRLSDLISSQQAPEEKESMLNLNKFYELAKTHEELYDADLANFLYYIRIVESLGIEIDAAQLEERGVRLMTSHASKGLEYRTVIVTNFAQGRFPSERHTNNALIPTELLPELKHDLAHLSEEEKEDFVARYERHHQLLEERRLCYVSFTRAKERLMVTYALEYSEKKTAPSAFLQEIEYKANSDIVFLQDREQKCLNQETEIIARPGPSFSATLQTPGFNIALQALAQQKPREQEMKQRLSPSALRLFIECQKEFEYRYVYHMPERKTISWEAMRLGSFVHLILEQGVRACFHSLQEFLELVQERVLDDEWRGVELEEAKTLIRVFFERNKGRYAAESKTEQYLALKLAGIDFMGFADRIDFNPDSIDIIDYKTGRASIAPQDRNWQLGFYALAAQEKYGLPARRVVLDMLKQERPLEFVFDTDGSARCISSKFIPGFSLQAVKSELLAAAQAVQKAYKEGFKACPIEKNCEFCNEYVYDI